MPTSQPKLIFEVLLDEAFSVINDDASITPTVNKRALSVINDFEDTKWRYTKFQNFIWDNIVETALSSDERQNLSHQSHSRIGREPVLHIPGLSDFERGIVEDFFDGIKPGGTMPKTSQDELPD